MEIEASLSQAERLIRSGDITGAERVLSTAWPDTNAAPAEAQHTWANIRIHQQRIDEAEQFLRNAVRLDPASLRHHIALGHFCTNRRNPAGAVEAYAAAMRIDRNWPGLAAVYARATYRAGRCDEAEKAARFWLESAPSADAWDTLSCALRGQGKAHEAFTAAEEGLRLEPQNTAIQHSCAAALLKLGRNQEALDMFDALIAGGVKAPAIYLHRGTALKNLKRDREAAATFAEGVSLYPADQELLRAAAGTRH